MGTRYRGATLAAAALCLMLTGCTVTTAGRPAAGPDLGHWQPPPIQAAQLDGLLLSPSEVSTIAGSANMTLRRSISRLVRDEDTVTNPTCLDIYAPIEQHVYRDTDWNVVTGQVLNDAGPAGSPRHALTQALVGFRDADAAQRFFRQAKTRWTACADKSVTVARPGGSISWSFSDVVTSDNTMAASQHPDIVLPGYACQRAMGVRNNVVIDTLWCGFDTAGQAGEVVAKIAAGVSHT